jgi:hypothetical protein
MRLLSVFFTATIATLVVALGATTVAAQEESARQALETREKAVSESTTRPPASGQSDRDAQANAACPGAALIDSVGPTDEDLVTTRPFTVTGDSFRLTYETTDADESGLPFVDVTVLDEAGNEVGGRVIFEEGTQQEIVRASPGRFDVETTAEDLKYKLTIEDCTGDENPTNGPASDDQYGNDGGSPDDEPLPNTGGVPLLGAGFFVFFCVSAAFALLRPAMRRDT